MFIEWVSTVNIALCYSIKVQVGGSRASDKGGGHPDPEIRGVGLKESFFRPSGLSLV